MRKRDYWKIGIRLLALTGLGVYFMGSFGILLTPGQANIFVLLFVPVFLLGIITVMNVILKRSPSGLRFETQPDMPLQISKALIFSMLPMYLFSVLSFEQGGHIMVWPYALFTLSLFLITIGRIFKTIEPNWICGIRAPNTLNSSFEWRNVHKRASFLMVTSGSISLLVTLWLVT